MKAKNSMIKKSAPQTNVAVVLKSIEKKAAPIMKRLAGLQITTNDEFTKAGKLMGELKELGKVADGEQSKITDPLQQALKATREHFKPFQKALDALQSDIKQKMVAWVNKQEAEKLKVAAKLESGDIKKVSTFLRKTEEATTAATSEHSVTRKIKVLVCVNAKATPREYLVPDEALIKAAIVGGKTVAGWKVELQNSIAI